jgi:hypothetical protein
MSGLRTMLERWRAKRDLYAQDGALVSGATIIGQVVSDLEAAIQDGGSVELVSLTEAARLCGYTADSLRRKIHAGELTDYGQPHKPRVAVQELPRKVDCLLNRGESGSIAESRRRTARGLISAA